jgi:hypothetical protein
MGTGKWNNLTGFISVKYFTYEKYSGHCAAVVILWHTCQTWERQNALAELLLYQDTLRSKLA